MAPVHVLRPMQRILQKEMVRECLAEFMSTYVMMVSERVALGVGGATADPTGHSISSPASELGAWERIRGREAFLIKSFFGTEAGS